MNKNLNAPWLFVIDTDDYAGNFERELCAYITGRVGECGVGDEMAKLFEQDEGEAFVNVVEEADDHGCHRPATIYPTTKGMRNYNSAAISFERKPTKKQIATMKARALKFAEMKCEFSGRPRISRISGFRLIQNIVQRATVEEVV